MVNRRQFLSAAVAAAATFARAPRAFGGQATKYDLLIKGGRVIDPSVRLKATRDVAISGGRIAAVEPSIAAEAVETIDARGKLANGTVVTGAIELRQSIMSEPEAFVSTVVQKLMVYALGRGLGGRDMATVRSIVRDTADDDYRFSSVVTAIVESEPFRMRKAPIEGVVASTVSTEKIQ